MKIRSDLKTALSHCKAPISKRKMVFNQFVEYVYFLDVGPYCIFSSAGHEKMDSVAKLTSEDWHLDANCGNFEQHREFFAKIYEIEKELLDERNKLDSQLRSENEMNSITGLLSSMKSYVK